MYIITQDVILHFVEKNI